MTTCPYCDCDLPATDGGKPRSYPQLKRYMSLCKRAYQHWPETHEMQFANAYECRKWLEMKVGRRKLVLQQPLVGIPETKLVPIITATVLAAMRSQGDSNGFCVPVVHKSTLYVWGSVSVKYQKMPHKEFCDLSDQVERLIREITGVGAEELRMMEDAA